MARPVVVDISELRQWGKLLATESVEIAARATGAVAKETSDVERRVLAAVPVLSGALRATVRNAGGGLRRRVTAGSAKAYYGRFQEFGTARMSPHPFLITQADPPTLAEFEARVRTAAFAGAIYRGET